MDSNTNRASAAPRAPKRITETQQVNIEAQVDENNQMRLSVCLPDTEMEAPPMDIVCIIDISYSMCGSATCQTDGKTEYEDLGFSLLDLVKHAVKTVVKTMRPQDRIAIILFDDKIQVPFAFTQLTDDNRSTVLSFLDNIIHRGSTNIYDALTKGIDLVLGRTKEESNNAAILFFTDGQPNCGKYSSSKSIVENIEKYMIEKKFKYPMHTFAFGQYTNCTSDLLFQIAEIFDGMFGYIQDAKTVGTIFINGIAYTLCTAINQLLMIVELDGEVIVPLHIQYGKDGMIKLPGLRYGQSADILFDLKQLEQFKFSPDSKLKVTLSASLKGKQQFPVMKEVQLLQCRVKDNIDHQLRFETINLFKNIATNFKTIGVEDLKKETLEFVERVKTLESDSDFIPGLLDTVDRQTVTMLEKQKYVEKWGEHQLRHLIRSLEMQCKGNFREQVLKDFGGDMFNDLADTADDIYNSMDPPKPSLVPKTQNSQVQVQNAQQFAAKMNNFDDDSDGGYYGGGCFTGDNIILMKDGSQKLVMNLTKNDIIATPDGKGARVRCVVRTETYGGMTDLCRLDNGLLVTPGHPVRLDSQWVYPRDISERRLIQCDAFYNLVVDQSHIAIINGSEVILLGHSYHEGILKHEYFGSNRVLQDLESMPGFNKGLINLKQGPDRQIKRIKGHEVIQPSIIDCSIVAAIKP